MIPDPTPVSGSSNGLSAPSSWDVIFTTAGLTVSAARVMADCSSIWTVRWSTVWPAGWPLEALVAGGAAAGPSSMPVPRSASTVPPDASTPARSAAARTAGREWPRRSTRTGAGEATGSNQRSGVRCSAPVSARVHTGRSVAGRAHGSAGLEGGVYA
jgi:hypothetical protein